MNRTVFTRAGVVLALVSPLFLLTPALASAATFTLAAAPDPCAVTGTPFLTINQNISNDADSGDHGNWATDAFTEVINVWVGTDGSSYCANAVANNATFVTTGPLSPQAGVALAAGITGTFTGGENYTFASSTGLTLNSIYSTTSPQTLNFAPSTTAGFSTWVHQIFPDVAAGAGSSYVNTYSLTYVTANNGSWVDSDPVSGGNDTGDITNSLNTVYVDSTTGNDTTADGTQAHPYATIQAGINAAATGGKVMVDAGAYTGAISLSKAITLDGANAGVSANNGTTVASRGAESVIGSSTPVAAAITVTTNDPVVIDGFTFNGTASPISSPNGNPSQITFRNNVVENTTGYMYFANTATLDFENNYLTNLETPVTDPNSEGLFFAGNWNGSTGSTATFAHNVWENTGNTGMNLSNVSGSITNNLFKSVLYYGILLANNSSSMTISGNTFDTITNDTPSVSTYGSGVRFYTPSYTGPVVITGNTFKNSVIGLGVRSPAAIGSMDIEVNHNTFTSNTTDVKDDGTGAFNVSYNYWGGGAPIIGGTGTSSVSFSPWYTDAAMTNLEYQFATSSTATTTTATSGSSNITLTGTSTESSNIVVTAKIPAGTTVTGDASWDGTISAPAATTATVSVSGFTTSVSSAVTIGSSEGDLTFSNAVQLTFAGEAGQLVGWYNHAGTFTQITDTCADNTQTTNDANIAAGGSCMITSGSDLIVWTKHFSTFVTYSQTATPPAAPVSSGGGGGGGGMITGSADFGVVNGSGTGSTGSGTGSGSGGQVLGASTFNFTANLGYGSRAAGVSPLQQILINAGYLKISAPTGWFGPLTLAAVKQYQTAHGIINTGFVGVLTRAQLNSSI